MKKASLGIFFYRYRFFIGSFLLSALLGFYTDLKPLGEQLYALTTQEENLTLQLLEKEKAVAQVALVSSKFMSVRASATPLLDEMLQEAQLNYLNLTTVSTEKNGSETEQAEAEGQSFIIKAVFKGEFGDFYRFLAQLRRQDSPLLLTKLAMKREEGSLVLSLQVSAFPLVLWLSKEKSAFPKRELKPSLPDPFQEAKAYSAAETDLQQLRLEELRYIGYLAQGDKRSALLLLNNGAVQEVFLGSIVGKEKWRIIQMDSQTLGLQSEDKKQVSQLKRE